MTARRGRARKLLLSDRRRRRNWLERQNLLTEFESGRVYTLVPITEFADVPIELTLWDDGPHGEIGHA